MDTKPADDTVLIDLETIQEAWREAEAGRRALKGENARLVHSENAARHRLEMSAHLMMLVAESGAMTHTEKRGALKLIEMYIRRPIPSQDDEYDGIPF